MLLLMRSRTVGVPYLETTYNVVKDSIWKRVL